MNFCHFLSNLLHLTDHQAQWIPTLKIGIFCLPYAYCCDYNSESHFCVHFSFIPFEKDRYLFKLAQVKVFVSESILWSEDVT